MRGVTSMRRLSTALGFLWVVFGVSHTSSSSNSLLIGDLEATTTSDTTLQCAHIAKFSVVRADDATPITFMHHVCMHPTRGVVAEAQLSVQQLGRGLSDDQRREAFVTLVSKFAAFTSSQILASVPPEHEFRLLHVDEDSQSVPSSVFPVTIDGFTAEMRIFHGEPIQTRLSFFCRTWLLEEGQCVAALRERIGDGRIFKVPGTDEPNLNDHRSADAGAASPSGAVPNEQSVAQPLNNSNQHSHVAELLSHLRRDAAAVDAVASFLSTGRWRTKLHDGSPMPVRGPTGFQVKFAELLHSPNTSLPLDSLAHGFGLQGYLSKRSRDRIDVIILNRDKSSGPLRDCGAATLIRSVMPQHRGSHPDCPVCGGWISVDPVKCGDQQAMLSVQLLGSLDSSENPDLVAGNLAGLVSLLDGPSSGSEDLLNESEPRETETSREPEPIDVAADIAADIAPSNNSILPAAALTDAIAGVVEQLAGTASEQPHEHSVVNDPVDESGSYDETGSARRIDFADAHVPPQPRDVIDDQSAVCGSVEDAAPHRKGAPPDLRDIVASWIAGVVSVDAVLEYRWTDLPGGVSISLKDVIRIRAAFESICVAVAWWPRDFEQTTRSQSGSVLAAIVGALAWVLMVETSLHERSITALVFGTLGASFFWPVGGATFVVRSRFDLTTGWKWAVATALLLCSVYLLYLVSIPLFAVLVYWILACLVFNGQYGLRLSLSDTHLRETADTLRRAQQEFISGGSQGYLVPAAAALFALSWMCCWWSTSASMLVKGISWHAAILLSFLSTSLALPLEPVWRPLAKTVSWSIGGGGATTDHGNAAPNRSRKKKKKKKRAKAAIGTRLDAAPSEMQDQGVVSGDESATQTTGSVLDQSTSTASIPGPTEVEIAATPPTRNKKQRSRRSKKPEPTADPFAYAKRTRSAPRAAGVNGRPAQSVDTNHGKEASVKEKPPCTECSQLTSQLSQLQFQNRELESRVQGLEHAARVRAIENQKDLEAALEQQQQQFDKQLEEQQQLLRDVQQQCDLLQAENQKLSEERERLVKEWLRPASTETTSSAGRSTKSALPVSKPQPRRLYKPPKAPVRNPAQSSSWRFRSRLNENQQSPSSSSNTATAESNGQSQRIFKEVFQRHFGRDHGVDSAIQTYVAGIAEQYHASLSKSTAGTRNKPGEGDLSAPPGLAVVTSGKSQPLRKVCEDIAEFLPKNITDSVGSDAIIAFVVELGAALVKVQAGHREDELRHRRRVTVSPSWTGGDDKPAVKPKRPKKSFEYQQQLDALRDVFPELGARTLRRILRSCRGNVGVAGETIMGVLDDLESGDGAKLKFVSGPTGEVSTVDDSESESEDEAGSLDIGEQSRITQMVLDRYHMQEHRDFHNPHISQVIPKEQKSKVRYYNNEIVSRDGKRYMTLPPKSGHDATREDRMATSVSLAWIKRKRKGGQSKREPEGGFKKGPISSKHDLAKIRR